MALRRVLGLTLCALAAGGGGVAHADTLAPPGNSGVDQYLEVVPDAGGGATPHRDRSNVLPSATRRALERSGDPDAAALSRLVDKTAPDSVAARLASGESRAGASKREGRTGAPIGEDPARALDVVRTDTADGSATAALVRALGTDGMGPALPALLALSLLGAAALGVRRRRG